MSVQKINFSAHRRKQHPDCWEQKRAFIIRLNFAHSFQMMHFAGHAELSKMLVLLTTIMFLITRDATYAYYMYARLLVTRWVKLSLNFELLVNSKYGNEIFIRSTPF